MKRIQGLGKTPLFLFVNNTVSHKENSRGSVDQKLDAKSKPLMFAEYKINTHKKVYYIPVHEPIENVIFRYAI